MEPIVITNPAGAIELTEDQAQQIGLNITQDEQHGELKTFGVWNIPVSFKAICMSAKYSEMRLPLLSDCTEKTIYGIRTLTNVRNSGYDLEGYVSIKGKKYTAFTSSELFQVNGKLINASIIHARVK